MISKASASFVRIAPRKVRYVIDKIRSKSVRDAQTILSGSPRRAGEILVKLLGQAVDAAKKNSQIEAEHLIVSKVLADGGPSMRRFRAASMGRAGMFRKRTSHITIELDLAKKGQPAPLKTPARAQAAPKVSEAAATKKKTSKPAPKKTVGAR